MMKRTTQVLSAATVHAQNMPRKYGAKPNSPVGSQYQLVRPHGQHKRWYKTQWFAKKPWAIECHYVPRRILLDRDLIAGERWRKEQNLPEEARWEKVVNGVRVLEDRWALVEEEGVMHKVNWKLYSQRLENELQAARDNLPQYTIHMVSLPIQWKALDLIGCSLKGLSVREAVAQCKLSKRKPHTIFNRALEIVQQGADQRGLDKEKLRISTLSVSQGKVDKQVDLRSRGYYGWKQKRSSNLLLTVTEDPEMVLPDRSQLPFASIQAMRAAGLHEDPVVLDVPAITAEGI